MSWVEAIPWNKVLKKAWEFLAFNKEGRGRERNIIVIGALLVTFFLYFWAVETVDPSRNLFRFGLQSLIKKHYTFASSKPGGWYYTLATHVTDTLGSESNAKVDVKSTGGSAEILKFVVENPRSIGIIQDDVLTAANLGQHVVRVVAPLYNERLHVVYRWSKLEEIAASNLSACTEIQNLPPERCAAEVRLTETPGCLTRELFRLSEVRLGSSGRPTGRLNTAQRVLALAGLQANREEFGLGIRDTIEAMGDRRLDVAFITAGARLPALESKLDSDSDLCLASIDGRFNRLLNEVYNTDYRFSGFSQIYSDRFNPVATIGIPAVLVANPGVPRSTIRSVAEALSNLRKQTPEDTYHPLTDYDEIDALQRVLPSARMEMLQAGVIFGVFVLAVWTALIRLTTWVVSSFKEATYARRLQHIYEQLPSHAALDVPADGPPVPKVDEANDEEILSRIVRGISTLLELVMDIRKDYESGGITSAHQHHLIDGVYQVKQIFMRHLAQRLHHAMQIDPSAVTAIDLGRYYTAGYLPREDYRFLRGLVE